MLFIDVLSNLDALLDEVPEQPEKSSPELVREEE